jgi:hypothetical protein
MIGGVGRGATHTWTIRVAWQILRRGDKIAAAEIAIRADDTGYEEIK